MVLRKNTLKYKLLQFLAFLGDAGIELLMNEVLVSGKLRMPNRRLYSARHFERVLKELTTTGYIDRLQKGGTAYLKLSSQANIKIARYIPLPYLQKKKWDGYFRGLSYDFPEKIRHKRDLLREKIKEWGLAKFQLSLYITPHPIEESIEEFLAARKLDKYAYIFVNRKKLQKEEGRIIAEQTWKLNKLQKEFEDFLDKWEIKLEKGVELADLEQIRFDYFALIEKDPYLPFDLLPDDWDAQEAKNLYLTVEKTILQQIKITVYDK